jgi:hypothetical protein
MYTLFKKHVVDVVVTELQTLHSINQKVQPSSKVPHSLRFPHSKRTEQIRVAANF